VRLEGGSTPQRKEIPPIPLAHAANMKEIYESMKLLLGKIKYDEFKWKLCGDLKVVALLLGIQLEYTKYSCFLCEWFSLTKRNTMQIDCGVNEHH
jgi:hypothetical protein